MTSADFYTMHTLLLCVAEVPDVVIEFYMAFEHQLLLKAVNSSLILSPEKGYTEIYLIF